MWADRLNIGTVNIFNPQISVGISPIVQVLKTEYAFAALQADGSIASWEDPTAGGDSRTVASQIDGNVDITAVASTKGAFAALRADGSVVTWGNGLFGGESTAVSGVLDGSIDVISLASTMTAFAALRADGSLVTWGNPSLGGDSTSVASKNYGDIRVVSVIATSTAFAALRADRSVVTLGDSAFEGNSSNVASRLDESMEAPNVFSNFGAFAALRADGSVVTWGSGPYDGDSTSIGSQLDGAVDIVWMSDPYSDDQYITVSPINRAPTSMYVSVQLNSGQTLISVLPVPNDADGDAVIHARSTDPTHGTVTVGANSVYTYTPAVGYVEPDNFNFTVSDAKGGIGEYLLNLQVLQANRAPTASGVFIASTRSDTNAPFQGILPIATDPDSDPITYSKASDPLHGSVVVSADGYFTYTPQAGYVGADSFSFSVSDGKGGSNSYLVELNFSQANRSPSSTNGSITTTQDVAVTGRLPAAFDADGDTVTYAVFQLPEHGVVSVTADGAYAYTPTRSYTGADFFVFTVSDGRGGFASRWIINIDVVPGPGPDLGVFRFYEASWKLQEDKTYIATGSFGVGPFDLDGSALLGTDSSLVLRGHLKATVAGFTLELGAGPYTIDKNTGRGFFQYQDGFRLGGLVVRPADVVFTADAAEFAVTLELPGDIGGASISAGGTLRARITDSDIKITANGGADVQLPDVNLKLFGLLALTTEGARLSYDLGTLCINPGQA